MSEPGSNDTYIVIPLAITNHSSFKELRNLVEVIGLKHRNIGWTFSMDVQMKKEGGRQ